ncbi:hypothetical protein Rhopal_003605-T1 [Rhodotorula paludigena]|uniref:Transmembrane protein n=1 Tax=Rhodotorula paludigena TaxID=86838 RepID=A0AAV5GPJ9_9BASI|nr:hypothetical protein Rhopal_003605-T1 [Rhodotorula paludigena]
MGRHRRGPPSDSDPEEPLTEEDAAEDLDDSGDDKGAGPSAGGKGDKFERYRTRHKLLWVALSGTVAVLDAVVAVMQCVLSLGIPASLYGTAAAFNGLAALYIGAAALAIQFGVGGRTHFDMGIALLQFRFSLVMGNTKKSHQDLEHAANKTRNALLIPLLNVGGAVVLLIASIVVQVSSTKYWPTYAKVPGIIGCVGVGVYAIVAGVAWFLTKRGTDYHNPEKNHRSDKTKHPMQQLGFFSVIGVGCLAVFLSGAFWYMMLCLAWDRESQGGSDRKSWYVKGALQFLSAMRADRHRAERSGSFVTLNVTDDGCVTNLVYAPVLLAGAALLGVLLFLYIRSISLSINYFKSARDLGRGSRRSSSSGALGQSQYDNGGNDYDRDPYGSGTDGSDISDFDDNKGGRRGGW